MKKYKEPKEITLLNSQAWLNYECYTYEDYLDYCEANDIEPASKDSREFSDWQLEECYLDVECDLDNIKECKKYEYSPFVITGGLGLWDGHHGIVPEKVTGLYEAIMKCWGNCDDCEAVLDTESGIVKVYAYHHDGTNCFEIHLLRDYCVEAYDRAYDAWNWGDAKEIDVKAGWMMKIRNPYAIGA